MRYEEIPDFSEAKFREIMKHSDRQEQVLAVIGAGLHGDLRWSASALRNALSSDDNAIATAAATALGHLFRRYKQEDLRLERNALVEKNTNTARLKSAVQNALDDYEVFHTSSDP